MRLEGRRSPDGPAKEDVEEMNRMMLSRLLPGDETMDKVMRYETRLHRFLLQKIYQILVLKGLVKTGTGRYFGLAQLDPPEVARPGVRSERPGLAGG
jgi:hypothetical protein